MYSIPTGMRRALYGPHADGGCRLFRTATLIEINGPKECGNWLHHRAVPAYEWTAIRSMTDVTPGADQAARSATSRSCQDRTWPVSTTFWPSATTWMPVRFQDGVALQRILHLLLHVRRLRLLLQVDPFVMARHAVQAVQVTFGQGALVLPVHGAAP